MKQLSRWAFQWPQSARFIIAFVQILVFSLMIQLAYDFQEIGVYLPLWLFWFSLLVVLAGYFFLYNIRIKTKRRLVGSYYRRKLFDGTVIAASFLLVLVAFNRNMTWVSFQHGVMAGLTTHQTSIPVQEIIEPAGITRKSNKLSRMEKKSWRKEIRKISQDGQGGKIALIIILSVILILGLAVVSCAIACEGPVLLGIGIFVVGTGAIIYGIVRWIQKIRGKPKQNVQ
ncbi:hypothetical protein [Flavihumibacter sp. UBA7668]|uniref:hypothetical protein n=1 Tax=Flavihumibacter sp. UBA7668 TaxID=1946542 RepID=UPI0025C21901|nr:hypothetical protein [Flavihumibacter sp. UBA7668]